MPTGLGPRKGGVWGQQGFCFPFWDPLGSEPEVVLGDGGKGEARV